jgi:hypothetical protein
VKPAQMSLDERDPMLLREKIRISGEVMPVRKFRTIEPMDAGHDRWKQERIQRIREERVTK